MKFSKLNKIAFLKNVFKIPLLQRELGLPAYFFIERGLFYFHFLFF